MEKVILIVDDEPEITDSIKGFLDTKGYSVITACDGQDAMEKFYSHKPHLVLLDLKMPNKNGYEVAREIKAVSDCAVIIVSAYLQKMDGLEDAVASGVHDFFTKPVDFQAIYSRIRLLLGELDTSE